jgi:hypothetical protein
MEDAAPGESCGCLMVGQSCCEISDSDIELSNSNKEGLYKQGENKKARQSFNGREGYFSVALRVLTIADGSGI